MINLSLISIVMVSALLAVPFATSAQSTNPANNMSQNKEEKSANSKLASSDESFFNNAAEAGLAEIEGAKLAQQKAATKEVKDFAAHMITDHTKVNEELKALADAKGHKLPTEPSMMQKAELKALSILDDKFDVSYVDRMAVVAHEKTIALFKDAAAKSADADIKMFAQKILPSLEGHLKMAKELEPTVSKTK